MSVFWQSVLAVFAAVGFYALLHKGSLADIVKER